MIQIENRIYIDREGLHDAEQPYEPYPEVYTHMRNKKMEPLRLFIEAVWEREMTDCAATRELVVRPLENGSFPICFKSSYELG